MEKKQNQTMSLSSFNALNHNDARALLRTCVDIDRWVDSVVVGRPYSSIDKVLQLAREASNPWSEQEIDGALAHHPRIGGSVKGDDANAAHSRSEQAGMNNADAAVTAALVAGNRAYEEKFDRVFLIRAAGRSATQMLEALNARLRNTPEQELAIVAEQLRQIALLRLEGALAP